MGQGEREEEEEGRSENGTSGGVLQNTEVRASRLTKGRPEESLVMGHWRANQQFSVSSKANSGTGESTARVGVRSPADRGRVRGGRREMWWSRCARQVQGPTTQAQSSCTTFHSPRGQRDATCLGSAAGSIQTQSCQSQLGGLGSLHLPKPRLSKWTLALMPAFSVGSLVPRSCSVSISSSVRNN